MEIIRVEPHSSEYREEDVLEISVEDFPIDHLSLLNELDSGEPINLESITNERIANSIMMDYGETEEEATQAIVEECGADWCELLNYILAATGEEVSVECTMTLLEI